VTFLARGNPAGKPVVMIAPKVITALQEAGVLAP
jgi:hypothetical protein